MAAVDTKACTATSAVTSTALISQSPPHPADRWLEHGPDLPPPKLAGSAATPFVFSVTAQRRLTLTDALLRRARIHDWAQHGDKAFLAHGSAIVDRPQPKQDLAGASALTKNESPISSSLHTDDAHPTASSQQPAAGASFKRIGNRNPKKRNKPKPGQDEFDQLLQNAISAGTALTSDVRHVERGAAKLDNVFKQIPLPPTAIHQPTATEVALDLRATSAVRESTDPNRLSLELLTLGGGVTTEEAVVASQLALTRTGGSKAASVEAGKIRKLRAVWNCYRQPHSTSAHNAMRRRGVSLRQAPFSRNPWQSLKRPEREDRSAKTLRPHEDLVSQVEQEYVDVDGNTDMRPYDTLKSLIGKKRNQVRKLVGPIEVPKSRIMTVQSSHDAAETAALEHEVAYRHALTVSKSQSLQLTKPESLTNSILADEMRRVQLATKRELGRMNAEQHSLASVSKASGQSAQTKGPSGTTVVPDLVRSELPSIRRFCQNVRLREGALVQRQQLQSAQGLSNQDPNSSGSIQGQGRTSRYASPQNTQSGLNPLDVRVLAAEQLTKPLAQLSAQDRCRLEAYTKTFDDCTRTTASVATPGSSNRSNATVTHIKPGAPALRPPISVICPPTYDANGEPTMDISRLMAYSEVLSDVNHTGPNKPLSAVPARTAVPTQAVTRSNDAWYGPVYYVHPR